MNSFQARQTIRIMICVSCLSAYQTIAIAQGQVVTPAAAKAQGWQSSSRPKTIALPQVQTVSGHQASNQTISTTAEFIANPSELELGYPQAPRQSDPIPASPWSVGKPSTIFGSSMDSQASAQRPPEPYQDPSHQPRFIEQPSTKDGILRKDAPNQTPRDIEFEINSPLSQSNGTHTPFYTASSSQVVQQPFNIGSHQTSIELERQSSVQLGVNGTTPHASQDWNQLPLRGVQVSNIVGSPEQTPAQQALPKQVVGMAPTVEVAAQTVNLDQVPKSVESTPYINDPYVAHAQETLERREKLAAQVSKELLATKAPSTTAAKAIELPRGWNAVQEDLQFRLKNCDDLLRRGATQSAREEVLIGLHSLSRAIDVREGACQSETSLQRALTAFEEEKDFYRDRSSSSTDISMIAGHQTPALRSKSTNNLSPIVASQHYRAYAKQQLIATSRGHTWAAELYYALGRTLESESESNQELGYMLREQAITCYQAALEIDRSYGDAANQLGYSLLRVDRPQEAEVALTAAVSIAPTPQAWKNLAEVYRRSGDAKRSELAVQQAMALENNVLRMSNGQPMPQVLEMSAEQFALMSPNTLQGVPNTQYLPQPQNVVQPAIPQAATSHTAASTEPAKAGRFEAIKRIFR
jgi:tetratricopeptide (TPR) repeat protein